jgi:hypothetical protein
MPGDPRFRQNNWTTTIARLSMERGVAQLGSAPVLGTGGPRFESGHPDHIPSNRPDSTLTVSPAQPIWTSGRCDARP